MISILRIIAIAVNYSGDSLLVYRKKLALLPRRSKKPLLKCQRGARLALLRRGKLLYNLKNKLRGRGVGISLQFIITESGFKAFFIIIIIIIW